MEKCQNIINLAIKKVLTMDKASLAEVNHHSQILGKALVILPNDRNNIDLLEKCLYSLSMINQKQIYELAEEYTKLCWQ